MLTLESNPALAQIPWHTYMVEAERGAQLAAASMSGATGVLAGQSPVDDPGFEGLDSLARRTLRCRPPESWYRLFVKAVTRNPHRVATATLLRADAHRLRAQDNPYTTSIFGANTTTALVQ